jgi:hypothetical protein
MGWTSFPMHESVKDWFTREYTDDQRQVLDVALVKRSTLYAAVLIRATGQVVAFVFLIRWSRDVYNFSYKDMTEFSGPCECECPKRIMKLLTPLEDTPENQYAINWRNSVKEYWVNKERLNSGDVFKTKDPVEFTSGARYQYFKKIGRAMYAGRIVDNVFRTLCRVRINLNHYNIEAINCQ